MLLSQIRIDFRFMKAIENGFNLATERPQPQPPSMACSSMSGREYIYVVFFF
jgi:hypothetical protein